MTNEYLIVPGKSSDHVPANEGKSEGVPSNKKAVGQESYLNSAKPHIDRLRNQMFEESVTVL